MLHDQEVIHMVDRSSIAELAEDGTLTPRQAEVAQLLIDKVPAREIAAKLGISRNAVYSQIAAIKKKGLFDPSYTPSGEVRVQPHTAAQAMLENITRPAAPSTNGATSAQTEVIRELIAQNRMLLEIVDRLTRSS
jgi:DNA-binding CsgD family transcriptional regulator